MKLFNSLVVLVKQHKVIFIIFFVAVLAFELWSDSVLRLAKESKYGIVSLELDFSQHKAAAMVSHWKTGVWYYDKSSGHPVLRKDLFQVAWADIIVDFLFILGYGLLLGWINSVKNEQAGEGRIKNVNRRIIWACLLDCLENAGMLIFLLITPAYPAWLFSVPSLVKFLLLGWVILFDLDARTWVATQLRGFTRLVRDLFYIFRISPLTIVSLLAMLLFIWVNDQGQDLLLIINGSAGGPLLLYAVVVVLGLMNWHFPKYFHDKFNSGTKARDIFRKEYGYDENALSKPDASRVLFVPRLLGVATFFIPAFGMLAVLNVFGVHHPFGRSPMLLMLAALFLVQRCFALRYFNWLYDRKWLFAVVCTLLFLVPFFTYFVNNGEPGDIVLLFYGLLAYGVLFALLVVNRRAISAHFSLFLDKHVNRLIWAGVCFPVLLFIIYFVCNIYYSSGFAVRFMSFNVVMAGIITYYALFTLLTFWGKIRRINFSILFVLVLMSITLGTVNNFHFVDIKAASQPKQMALKQYITQWLHDRYQRISPERPVYKIYIVNSYGGGIRAAAWTCFAINKLDSMQLKKTPGDAFQDHVLAYSGASGGTIGSSVLCANKKINHVGIPSLSYDSFYANDYLTAVLTGLVGNDIWYSGLHITCGNDRSKVQEHLWESYFSHHFHSDVYGNNVDAVWDSTQTSVPLLFSNTTDVKLGRKGVFAPVKLDASDFPGATIIHDLMGDSKTLKLSTAAFLSARFPYLSPAGAIRDNDHNFLDGGMVDNAGAETAMQVYQILKSAIATDTNYKNCFKVYLVSLKNSYQLEATHDSAKEKNIPQLMAPITALTNVGVEGNTKKADGMNESYFNNNRNGDQLAGKYYKVQPVVELLRVPVTGFFQRHDTDLVKVPLPLGWSISDLALERMRVSADSLCLPGRVLFQIINE